MTARPRTLRGTASLALLPLALAANTLVGWALLDANTIDIDRLDGDGFAQKTEVADLLSLADPFDLNRDGKALLALTEVPEPSTTALLLAGIGACGWVVRRQSR